MKKIWTNEEINIIKQLYYENGPEFCQSLIPNKSKKKISTKASELGINFRGKHYLKENLFLNPNTPEIVYLLGLMWADGYINCKYNKLSIKLVSDDMKQIIPIAEKVGIWSIIYEKSKKYKESCKIECSNKEIVNFLNNNDYHAKSHESADKILSLIPDNLKHYWFRGLFDGDGNLYTREHNSTLTICSSLNQNWNYLEILCKMLNIKYSICRHSKINKKTGKLNSGSELKIYNRLGIKKFGEFIYQNINNDNIGLKRKYNSFISILN